MSTKPIRRVIGNLIKNHDPKVYKTKHRGGHTAPVDPEYHAPLHDLTKTYPEDIYSAKGPRYYGHGDIDMDRPSFAVFNKVRNNPDAEVTIYRAVPENAPDEIQPGDWVTINPNYAETHAEMLLDRGEGAKIVEAKTKAKYIRTDGNSPHEFGYTGGDLNMSQQARLARAKAQGFDVDRPVYHGTAVDFDEFDPDYSIGTQFWSTTDKAAIEAGEVGAQGRGVIKEMYHRIKNPAGWEEYDKFGTDELIARGYDGLALPESDGSVTYVAFSPNQYRDINAAFDPERTDSSKLLAGTLAGTVGAGAMTAGNEAQAAQNVPPPPPGFVLTDSAQNVPPPPPGFVLTEPTQEAPRQPASPRMARGQQMRQGREKNLATLREQAAASGIPLARDLPEIGASPELNRYIPGTGVIPAVKASVASLFTFDDKELGDILTKQIGAEIVQDIEGNYVANMPSGESYAINKPDFSAQDLAKTAATVGAYTPAGRLASIPAQVAGGVATATAIEAGQKAAGGTFDTEDIAMEAVAPVVVGGVARGVKALRGRKPRPPAIDKYVAKMPSEPPKPKPQAFTAKEKPKFKELRDSINNGDVTAVGWKLDKTGKVVKDPIQRKLVREGIDESVVVAPLTMSAGTKQASRDMLDVAEKFLKNPAKNVDNRPNVVIGENIMKRFDVVNKKRMQAGARIGAAVDKDLAGKAIDVTQAENNFLAKLKNMGIALDNGTGKLIFDGSRIPKSNHANIVDAYRVFKNSTGDGEALHGIKQSLSTMVDYGPGPIIRDPIDAKVVNAIDGLRGDINDALRNASPDYKQANKEFSEAADVLTQYTKAFSIKDFDPKDPRMVNRLGQESRKALTNYKKSNDVVTAMQSVDALAKKYGGEFDDDLLTQVALYNELERVFGSYALGGFQSLTERGVSEALRNTGLAGQAVELAKDVYEKNIAFKPPTKEKLQLLELLRKQMKD